MRLNFVLSALLCLSVLFKAQAAPTVIEMQIATDHHPVSLVRITDGLDQPWSVAFLPDGDMLVTEKSGRLLRISENGQKSVISGTPAVADIGQGGLLDVALHPDFEENNLIYLTYSKAGKNDDITATALARGRLVGNRLQNLEDLFVQNIYSEPGRHYGSRIAFTQDGKILISVGDRGSVPLRAQDLRDHAGSVIRLNLDGSVPEDNPFVGLQNAAEEIYSYGHRNIQGMVVHPETGDIWATEHGPRGGDELNLVKPALNYGWPVISYGRHYGRDAPFGIDTHKDGMEQPVRQWTPSPAVSGLAVVTSPYFPAWNGNLLVGALSHQSIRRVALDGSKIKEEEILLSGLIGRIRDVRQGPDGYIYILTDQADGGLYRLEPAQ